MHNVSSTCVTHHGIQRSTPAHAAGHKDVAPAHVRSQLPEPALYCPGPNHLHLHLCLGSTEEEYLLSFTHASIAGEHPKAGWLLADVTNVMPVMKMASAYAKL